MDELLLVRAADCRPLREAILRPGQPPEAWTYAGDDDGQALHFAVKNSKGLVQGVATVLPEGRNDGGTQPWRLRGMAVLPGRRGAGLGRMLLQAVQAVIQQRGGGLWCTARVDVEGFYLAHGFRREGRVFDLPGGGPHVLMTWEGVGKRMKPVPRRGAPGAESDELSAGDGAESLAGLEDEDGSDADGGSDDDDFDAEVESGDDDRGAGGPAS